MHSGYASQAARRLFSLSAQQTAQQRALAWTTSCEQCCRPSLASNTSRPASANQWRGQCSQSDDQVPPEAAPPAALLLIGNEILSGAIEDTNTPWIAKLLYRCDGLQFLSSKSFADNFISFNIEENSVDKLSGRLLTPPGTVEELT